MPSKILFVDDEPDVLSLFERALGKRFLIETATDGHLGLEKITDDGPFGVVVSDMRMPGMDGIEFLAQVAQKAPDSVRIMLTGNSDQKTAIEAVNKGQVFQFLTKPFELESLIQAIRNGIRQHQMIRAEKELLQNTLNGSIRMLTEILSSIAPEAFSRGLMLKQYIKYFAGSFPAKNIWQLELAAMLLNIGRVSIPANVMVKVSAGDSLSADEKDMITRLPEVGSHLIEKIPRLEEVARIVLYHNKNYDGSGFPLDSVTSDEIPVGSRILRILSDLIKFENLGSPRFKAFANMRASVGLYDPNLLEAIMDFSKDTDVKCTLIKNVTVGELKIDDVLASSIETIDGLKIADEGMLITQLVLEKVRNFSLMTKILEPIAVRT